jgi:hypothetical protein
MTCSPPRAYRRPTASPSAYSPGDAVHLGSPRMGQDTTMHDDRTPLKEASRSTGCTGSPRKPPSLTPATSCQGWPESSRRGDLNPAPTDSSDHSCRCSLTALITWVFTTPNVCRLGSSSTIWTYFVSIKCRSPTASSTPDTRTNVGARPDHGIVGGISQQILSAATQCQTVNLIDQFIYDR